MNKIKLFIKSYRLTIIGVLVGGIGGYFYWLKIGCASGTCPITSSPFMSTIWGVLMGGTIFNIFEKKNETSNNQ